MTTESRWFQLSHETKQLCLLVKIQLIVWQVLEVDVVVQPQSSSAHIRSRLSSDNSNWKLSSKISSLVLSGSCSWSLLNQESSSSATSKFSYSSISSSLNISLFRTKLANLRIKQNIYSLKSPFSSTLWFNSKHK